MLEDNSIALGDVAPASFGADAVSFPITSGKLDATSLGGSVTHRGGLRISVGAVSVALRDLVVDTKAQQVTALVGHGRMPIFDLDQRQLSGSVSGGQLTGTGAVALLTPRAASALNAALSVSVFTPKLIFGDVTIDAKTA